MVDQEQRCPGTFAESRGRPVFKREADLPADGQNLGMSQNGPVWNAASVGHFPDTPIQRLLERFLILPSEAQSVRTEFKQNAIRVEPFEKC